MHAVQTFGKIECKHRNDTFAPLPEAVIMSHPLLDTTQVISLIEVEGAPYEVCVEALASHDRSSSRLTVQLRAFLRAEKHDHIGEVTTPSWLPEPETVTEHVSSDEAHAVANDVFSSWRHKVTALLPK